MKQSIIVQKHLIIWSLKSSSTLSFSRELAGKRKREPDRDEVDNLDELIKKLT